MPRRGRLLRRRRRHTAGTGRRSAFTLVELLVVIGIIALLIAILLPALSRAREQANLLKCLTTLRAMGQAAHLHAAEHRGYMPVAGGVTELIGPRTPDVDHTRYVYFWDEAGPMSVPAPLTAALGKYMNLPIDYTGHAKMEASLRQGEVIARFACPDDRNPAPADATSLYVRGAWKAPAETMSYVLNAGVLEQSELHPQDCPMGNASRVRRPAEVFLFADGRGGHAGYAIVPSRDDWSMYDAWRLGGAPQLNDPVLADSYAQFAPERHRGRANVVFVDGHGETITTPQVQRFQDSDPINDDFKRVGVSKGIYH